LGVEVAFGPAAFGVVDLGEAGLGVVGLGEVGLGVRAAFDANVGFGADDCAVGGEVVLVVDAGFGVIVFAVIVFGVIVFETAVFSTGLTGPFVPMGPPGYASWKLHVSIR